MKGTNRILLSVPHMGGTEEAYVRQAFSSNWLSTVGPNIAAFEREFEERIGLPAVALGSGTAAIHLGLRLLGVGPGDEVLCPTLTFVATANPIRYLGAEPVFIDSERASWNMDPELLRGALSERRPKAVIVVHLYGQCADMGPILEVCGEYGVPVLEDAAEALGANYRIHHRGTEGTENTDRTCQRLHHRATEGTEKRDEGTEKREEEGIGNGSGGNGDRHHCPRASLGTVESVPGRPAGTMGDVGVFSFNGNKIITTTGGGMLVARRKEWVDKARFWATQARDPGIAYEHSEMGYNYRMSNVLAGIGRGQLEVLDLRVRQRRAIAFRYREAFADLTGISLMPQAPYGLHTNWLSCFLIDEGEFGCTRDELIRRLDAANIESRPVWKPMHLQPLYAGCERYGGEVAEDLFRRGICLPSSSSLSLEEQMYVVNEVRKAAGAREMGELVMAAAE